MQADTSTEQAAAPSDLAALVMALRLLVAAFEATVESRPALALLWALQRVLLVVEHFEADPAHRRLDVHATTGPGESLTAGLTCSSADAPRRAASPTPTPSTSSSSTTRSTPAPALPSFQLRVCVPLADAFDALAEADQLAAHLALTSRGLAADRVGLALSNIDEITGDLRDALFALAGSLCEASHEATGLPVQCPPMAHALRLREVLDLDDEEGLRNLRRRQVLTDARKAFEGRTA